MANYIAGRTWKIDTPSATPVWPRGARVFIKFVEWYDAVGGLGDTFVITDAKATPHDQLRGSAQVAGDVQTFGLNQWIDGMIVPTLSSGFLLIHIN
jgi:hypothetical protein